MAKKTGKNPSSEKAEGQDNKKVKANPFKKKSK
jgi:hypothetical protein